MAGYHVYLKDCLGGSGQLTILAPTNNKHKVIPLAANPNGVLETLAIDVDTGGVMVPPPPNLLL